MELHDVDMVQLKENNIIKLCQYNHTIIIIIIIILK